MSSTSDSYFLFDEDQSSQPIPFKKSPDIFNISSSYNNCYLLNTSINFNQAYNEIFKPEQVQVNDIEQEDENSMSNIYSVSPIKTLGSNGIINENSNIIIDSTEKKIEKFEKKIEKNEKIDLFSKGKGIVPTLKKLGLTVSIKDKKINICEFKEKKFETKKMIKDEKGKIKPQKKRRKFKPDNIRKKIKSKFHRDLKNELNQKLKEAGSQKLFELLPQSFITNITVKLNKQVLDKTLKKLILYDCIEDQGVKEKNPDRDKYNKNLEVMKYLEQNEEISKKAGFDIIQRMKYEEILKAYFQSTEFENSLIELYEKNKSEKIDYIEEYVNKAVTYIEFFKNPPIKNIIKKGNNKEDIEEIEENLNDSFSG